MLIDDYLEYQIQYEKKYGSNTLVLMQVGSFFEFYGVNNASEKIGNAQYIAELLNIQLTRRNKSILENSRSNCLMAGFPTHALKRFIQLLIQNNYTIVLIEQTTEPPNPKREITQIYSPGTYIEEINHFDVNNIVSLYIKEEKCYKTHVPLFTFGLCSIDLSTGINNIYEIALGFYDKQAFYEEIYRFIENNNPREIIISYEKLEHIKLSQIIERLYNPQRIIHQIPKIDQKYKQLSYQNSYLKQIFNDTKMLSCIEYLDLEHKQYATISYLLLLEFAFEHNERLIHHIKKPTHWIYDDHLILYNNAMYQLNVFPVSNANYQSQQHTSSLFKIIDKTSSPLGKRFLKYSLHNPITCPLQLQKRYMLIEEFMQKNLTTTMEKRLNEIIDIERLHRKMVLNTLHPYEFLNLHYSYEHIQELISLVSEELCLEDYKFNAQLVSSFQNYMSDYSTVLNLEEIGKYNLLNMQKSFFHNGHYQEIDELQTKIDKIYDSFQDEITTLSNLIEKNSDFVKMENNDRDGYFLYTTKKRSDVLIKNLKKNHEYEFRKYTSSNIKIVSPLILENSHMLIQYQEDMKKLVKEKYIDFLNHLSSSYEPLLNSLCTFVEYLDFIKCGAKCASYYHYSKPEINNKFEKKSYVNFKEIRHPIIEIIHEDYEYVCNDISLNPCDHKGILLYGVNGVGKSSLSKAIGCNILLAQIGFYVASSSFEYYPYKKIFTRINGEDNIFKGMSSFVVEMDELRSILKYSDANSIVLGDEICKGTEEISALSIVSSSILRFCQNQVQFILATHFHKLPELKEIKEHPEIHCKHLSISYENGKLIYGRKLKDGCGDNLYGIEIANFIIDDLDFIQHAKKIRNELLLEQNQSNQLLQHNKKSNYNSKLIMNVCSICGVSEQEMDTHHIIEQHEFQKHSFFKNKLSNLVVLCQKHHDQVHHGNLKIYGYFETENGKELKYDYVEKVVKSKKKFKEEEILLIQNMWENIKEYQDNLKVMKQELKKKNINISKVSLTKIINREY